MIWQVIDCGDIIIETEYVAVFVFVKWGQVWFLEVAP